MQLANPQCPECGKPAYGRVQAATILEPLDSGRRRRVSRAVTQKGTTGLPLVQCEAGHEWQTSINYHNN